MSILFLFIAEAFMLIYVLGAKAFFSNAFYAFDFVMLIGTLILEVCGTPCRGMPQYLDF
jgi:hypothetical protein